MDLHWVDMPREELPAVASQGPAIRLAFGPAPRGGRGLRPDVRAARDEGVDVLVSLLEAEEAQRMGRGDEWRYASAAGMRFVNLPIPDHSVPADTEAVQRLCEMLREELLAGRGVAIHCLAGIGRSSLVAACTLHALGLVPAEAFRRLHRARGLPVPDTDQQRRWVDAYARRCEP